MTTDPLSIPGVSTRRAGLDRIGDEGLANGVEHVANFGRRNLPAEYALTMYANDASVAPASFAFEAWNPTGSPLQSLARVAAQGHGGRTTGTRPSRQRDTAISSGVPLRPSHAARKAIMRKDLSRRLPNDC